MLSSFYDWLNANPLFWLLFILITFPLSVLVSALIVGLISAVIAACIWTIKRADKSFSDLWWGSFRIVWISSAVVGGLYWLNVGLRGLFHISGTLDAVAAEATVAGTVVAILAFILRR
jgi:hypothetical protein